ncbi:MAG: hypothetical protein A3E85_00810 [Gammaproteobacteria bacterium RIFCSPHIGHO2_12_FULL_45_12]|nr:MAG: hypothetical protein A3E85_00810 [Gammaproteobacteria bacterium RIFCSPHIGHO2_12_FULL_45_12]
MADKRELNLEKHGMDFVGAVKVFDDPSRIEFSSIRKGGKRLQTLGLVHGVVISLIYTARKSKKRIISAKKASKNERETYYEKNA